MGIYAVEGTQTVTATPFDTTISIERGASKRAKITDVMSGFDIASPSDNLMIFTGIRGSASGTGTARTPDPLDPADGAAVTTAEENHTAEPTYTANTEFIRIGQHMRAAYRWVARPGGEIVIPNTAGALVGFRGEHATAAPDHTCTVHFEE